MATIAAISELEISLISSFVRLLNEEQEALKVGESSALAEIGAAKTALVEKLNGLESERRAALGIAGEHNTREAMSQWLAKHPEEQTAAVNWQKLLKLASEAKQLHELNAGLVAIHLQQTSEALAILTRRLEHDSLYGKNGQAAQISGSRIVDSA